MVVLSVSPHQSDHQFLEASAAACNCELALSVDLAGALVVLDQCEVSVVVFDQDLIPGSWRDMLRRLQERANPAALIVTSRLADERLWAEALNLGAWDVLAKPFDRCEVTRSIERAFQHWQFSAE
jgi:FixJ family two-component response regulator